VADRILQNTDGRSNCTPGISCVISGKIVYPMTVSDQGKAVSIKLNVVRVLWFHFPIPSQRSRFNVVGSFHISDLSVIGKTNFYITFAITFDKVIQMIFRGVAQLVPPRMTWRGSSKNLIPQLRNRFFGTSAFKTDYVLCLYNRSYRE